MNKGNFIKSRSFRHGSLSVAISIVVVALVIVLNTIVAALSEKFSWKIDMTHELIYTLSDECIDILDDAFETVNERREAEGEDDVKVNVIFCDLKDNIMASTYHRYVLDTALDLKGEFPDTVDVKFVNIWENPTAVNKFKATSTTKITSDTVIVESGTEFRTYDISKFYIAKDGAIWGYNGEKRLASAILAVTQLESPVACMTINHGETGLDPIYDVLDEAGFKIKFIDLVTEEIPDDCRLLVTFNPQSDFSVTGTEGETSEILKLRNFLEKNNSRSFAVFMSPTAPKCQFLEEYLALWGVSFERNAENVGLTVRDSSNALTNDGLSIIADYVNEGIGAGITSSLQKLNFPPKVVFRNAMPITLSECYVDTYEIDTSNKSHYGIYIEYGSTRYCYNMFTSSSTAMALADGTVVKTASGGGFPLMTITSQPRITDENVPVDDEYSTNGEQTDNASFVLACGSTEFASDDFINTNVFGNRDVLLSSFNTMGKEGVPVKLPITAFSDMTIDTLEAKRANRDTILLVAIPALTVFVIGAVVLIRRKNK